MQAGEELAAKDLRERVDRERGTRAAGEIQLPVGAERAGGDEAVHVQVLGERLAPGVQHQGGGDLAAEPARVLAELDQGVPRRAAKSSA